MAAGLKLSEVANRLGISERTARRYVRSGELPSVYYGAAYRVAEEDLEEFIESRRSKAPKARPQPDSGLEGSQAADMWIPGPNDAPAPREERGPSLADWLEREGIEAPMLSEPREEWYAAGRGQGQQEAIRNSVEVARKTALEIDRIVPLLYKKAPSEGAATLTEDTVRSWQEIIQRRLKITSGLEEVIEEAQEGSELRGIAEMVLEMLNGPALKSLEKELEQNGLLNGSYA